MEVRIFEEENSVITPVGKYKIIEKVPFMKQKPKYPTGCESVTTVMALNYANIPIETDVFLLYLNRKPSGPPFDPNIEFGGDPRLDSGYGCYSPVIKQACDTILTGEPLHAEILRGKSISSLCSEYIDNNIPVIFWGTQWMKPAYKRAPWNYNGKTIQWISPMHCLLLIGYDDNHYIFNDPLDDHSQTYYKKELVEAAYKALNQQAVVIVKNPSKEVIAKKKKEKFVETLNLLGVSGKDVDKGAFGLFREESSDVQVKEYLPGMEITYSCGYAASLGYSGNVAVIDVVNGKMNVASDVINNITTTFSMKGFKNPTASLNALAAEIDHGRIIVGIKVKNQTIALYYTASFDVIITDYYSETMNVTVKFEIKNDETPDGEPQLAPDFEFALVPSNEDQWLMFGMLVLAGVAICLMAPEFAALFLAVA